MTHDQQQRQPPNHHHHQPYAYPHAYPQTQTHAQHSAYPPLYTPHANPNPQLAHTRGEFYPAPHGSNALTTPATATTTRKSPLSVPSSPPPPTTSSGRRRTHDEMEQAETPATTSAAMAAGIATTAPHAPAVANGNGEVGAHVHAHAHADPTAWRQTKQPRIHPPPSTAPMAAAPPSTLPPLPSPPPLTLKSFDVVGTLGTGTFGRVLLVKLRDPHVPSPAYFALKVLEKQKVVKMKQVEHVKSEKEILAAVRHPFAVNLHATFQDSNCVYLLMEFARGGEIFSYLRKAGKFPTDVTRFYIATLVLLLDHLHSQDVIYRDLKPENLLLDAQGYTKLTDFGFAKRIPKGRTFTLCGTPEFLAPEIIRGRGHGKAADWWALGILTYEMLCGHPPFWSSDEEQATSGGPFATYEKILKGDLHFPKHVDVLSRDFIRSLLNADLSHRLGNLSGGARDVKRHLFFHNVDWNLLLARGIRPPIIPPPIAAGVDPMRNFARYEDPDPTTMPGLYGDECAGDYGPSQVEFDFHGF